MLEHAAFVVGEIEPAARVGDDPGHEPVAALNTAVGQRRERRAQHTVGRDDNRLEPRARDGHIEPVGRKQKRALVRAGCTPDAAAGSVFLCFSFVGK
jgi:hypothetical protein